jgi:uncharacterized protein (TIGR00369 family)
LRSSSLTLTRSFAHASPTSTTSMPRCCQKRLLRVKVSDELRNAPGAPVHGGVYAALVDAAIGCALATVNPESAGGVGQTTLDLNVTYLAAARGPTIFAEGTLLRRGRTVAFGEVRVTDDAGALLAVGRATYLILRAH